MMLQDHLPGNLEWYQKSQDCGYDCIIEAFNKQHVEYVKYLKKGRVWDMWLCLPS